MNQDNYLEEAFKFRNLLEEFDPLRSPDVKAHRDELQRPNPANNGADGSRASDNGILKCAILGFRENIFTANLMSVGTYMSLMEATFVSMTLRTFAWLGARMHYGHPDCLDKIFFMTRGGMSKASKMIHVSEDIFAGFKSTLRGGRILHKEYIQCGKGRDLGFNQLYLFEAKLASVSLCYLKLSTRGHPCCGANPPLGSYLFFIGWFIVSFSLFMCCFVSCVTGRRRASLVS